MHKRLNLLPDMANDDLRFRTVAAEFAAAAIHEAMHSKVDEGEHRAGRPGFNLHRQGGGGIALLLATKQGKGIDHDNNLIVTGENRRLLRAHFATPVRQFIRTDFFF
jgi:hypothetical protein